MVKYKGTTLYPPAVFDVLDNIPYIENYVMTVSNNEYGNDRIIIKVGLRKQPSFDITKDLKDHFRARIRVAPEIKICSPDDIRKISFPDMNRKPVKFIDNRNNTDNHAK
jgi:phenylacetate-CoA ligase